MYSCAQMFYSLKWVTTVERSVHLVSCFAELIPAHNKFVLNISQYLTFALHFVVQGPVIMYNNFIYAIRFSQHFNALKWTHNAIRYTIFCTVYRARCILVMWVYVQSHHGPLLYRVCYQDARLAACPIHGSQTSEEFNPLSLTTNYVKPDASWFQQ